MPESKKTGAVQNRLPDNDHHTRVIILPIRSGEGAELGKRIIRVSEEEIKKYGGIAELFYYSWVEKNGFPKHRARFHNGVLIIKLFKE